MIHNNIHILDMLMRDQKKQKTVFKAGRYWSDYIARIDFYIRKDGLESFRAHSGIGKGYTDTVTKDPFANLSPRSKSRILWKVLSLIPFVDKYIFSRYTDLIAKYLEALRQSKAQILLSENADLLAKYKTPLGKIDTMTGNPTDFIEYNEQKIAFAYIETLKRIENAAQYVDFKTKKAFMEVGGGFGANAHMLLSLYPNIKTCIYVDLPPMLHVGCEYLRHHFGERVMDYAEFLEQKENGTLNTEGRILCIPPWCLENIKVKTDLFWNSCSFQEMDDSQISYYAKWLIQNRSKDNLDVLALFYPFNTPKRHPDRSINLLTAEGFKFKKQNESENINELVYATGSPAKEAT